MQIELKDHIDKNIMSSSTAKVPKRLSCLNAMCEYVTTEFSNMDIHTFKDYGLILCDKFDYIAADQELMKEHKIKHTGGYLFICGI